MNPMNAQEMNSVKVESEQNAQLSFFAKYKFSIIICGLVVVVVIAVAVSFGMGAFSSKKEEPVSVTKDGKTTGNQTEAKLG